MKYLFLIFCLILCSCPLEEDENQLLPSSSSSIEPNIPTEPAYSVQFEPCPSQSFKGSVNPDPLILECPPEDIAECPVLKLEPWPIPNEKPPAGWGWNFVLSVEELLFGEQGMIRCVTSSSYILSLDGDGCRVEDILVSDSINDPPHFIGIRSFKRLICPWFTATEVSGQVIHISVDKNETGKERNIYVRVSNGNSSNGFRITQSAE